MEKGLVKSLLGKIPQVGEVVFVSVRPVRKQPPSELEEVTAERGKGLNGDHFAGKFSQKRAVTLIQKEHLDAVASILQKEEIDPLLTRRNIVVSGINLLSLRGQEFRIGDAILQGTGLCHPCARMEENLGPGGYNAMRGHGGITAQVIQGGTIRIGDKVQLMKASDAE